MLELLVEQCTLSPFYEHMIGQCAYNIWGGNPVKTLKRTKDFRSQFAGACFHNVTLPKLFNVMSSSKLRMVCTNSYILCSDHFSTTKPFHA